MSRQLFTPPPTTLRLLVRPPAPPARGRSDPRTFPVLEVPAGPSYLVPRSGGAPTLAARRPRRPALTLEPVRAGARAGLLAVPAPGLRCRIDGLPAPRVALLRVGDQLHLEATLLHVTEFRGPEVVTPAGDLLGKPCGVCRVPFTADTSVVVCPCSCGLHCEGPPKPEEERLACHGLVDRCPSCKSELRRETGFTYLPES